jgi:hypothetical protein
VQWRRITHDASLWSLANRIPLARSGAHYERSGIDKSQQFTCAKDSKYEAHFNDAQYAATFSISWMLTELAIPAWLHCRGLSQRLGSACHFLPRRKQADHHQQQDYWNDQYHSRRQQAGQSSKKWSDLKYVFWHP